MHSAHEINPKNKKNLKQQKDHSHRVLRPKRSTACYIHATGYCKFIEERIHAELGF